MIHGFGFGGFGWIGMIIGLVITIGVIIGVIWLMVYFARRGFPDTQGQSMTTSTSPREILQARYARGEITRDQYLQMLDDLS
jgi:putative membrane protein